MKVKPQAVTNDFAQGVMAAYALVKHIEDQRSSPFKSMLAITTVSAADALECYMRGLYVPKEPA